MFLATSNTPGYLPMDDDPPIFDTAREAWGYLSNVRREDEDDAAFDSDDPHPGYSEHVNALEALADGTLDPVEYGLDFDGTGTYGAPTAGERMYDLGVAYTVSTIESEDA